MDARKRQQLEAQLSAYLDGELSTEQRAEVEAFLGEDADARQLLAQLRDTVQAVRALPRVKASPDLMDGLRARLEKRALLGDTAPVRPHPVGVTRFGGRWVAAAAVIALSFAAGYVMWTYRGSSTPSGSSVGPLASESHSKEVPPVTDEVRPAARPSLQDSPERRELPADERKGGLGRLEDRAARLKTPASVEPATPDSTQTVALFENDSDAGEAARPNGGAAPGPEGIQPRKDREPQTPTASKAKGGPVEALTIVPPNQDSSALRVEAPVLQSKSLDTVEFGRTLTDTDRSGYPPAAVVQAGQASVAPDPTVVIELAYANDDARRYGLQEIRENYSWYFAGERPDASQAGAEHALKEGRTVWSDTNIDGEGEPVPLTAGAQVAAADQAGKAPQQKPLTHPATEAPVKADSLAANRAEPLAPRASEPARDAYGDRMARYSKMGSERALLGGDRPAPGDPLSSADSRAELVFHVPDRNAIHNLIDAVQIDQAEIAEIRVVNPGVLAEPAHPDTPSWEIAVNGAAVDRAAVPGESRASASPADVALGSTLVPHKSDEAAPRSPTSMPSSHGGPAPDLTDLEQARGHVPSLTRRAAESPSNARAAVAGPESGRNEFRSTAAQAALQPSIGGSAPQQTLPSEEAARSPVHAAASPQRQPTTAPAARSLTLPGGPPGDLGQHEQAEAPAGQAVIANQAVSVTADAIREEATLERSRVRGELAVTQPVAALPVAPQHPAPRNTLRLRFYLDPSLSQPTLSIQPPATMPAATQSLSAPSPHSQPVAPQPAPTNIAPPSPHPTTRPASQPSS